jgi:UDP-N-acetylmuramyl tripeptide synthase
LANPLTIALGKLIQAVARLKGGAGSAFPGLVVEKIEPDFAVRVLKRLPQGVVVISGTNGKTTTTKIVTELLQAQGLKVFTNATGSNFMRGVIASLLSQMTLLGRLDADIAVLELDEAHAVRFVQRIAPRYALLLNVMRDQLDRFGEIDHTADLLAIIARHTTGVVVVNREDNRLACFAAREELLASEAQLVWYGLAPELAGRFVQDDELYADEFGSWDPEPTGGVLDREGLDGMPCEETLPCEGLGDVFCGGASSREGLSGGGAPSAEHLAKRPLREDAVKPNALVTLEALDGAVATYAIRGNAYQTPLELKGIYNAYNAAAALALVRVILDEDDAGSRTPFASFDASADPSLGASAGSSPASPLGASAGASAGSSAGASAGASAGSSPASSRSSSDAQLIEQLAAVKSAFGRGESFIVEGRELEMLLVKNPGGFRLALESFEAAGRDTMIAINDEYADGRDMSWLYDVEFTPLRESGVAMVSGTRAFDMALRLRYDEVAFELVDTELERALDRFIQNAQRPMRLYCTYTAMLRCREHLGHYTVVSKLGQA